MPLPAVLGQHGEGRHVGLVDHHPDAAVGDHLDRRRGRPGSGPAGWSRAPGGRRRPARARGSWPARRHGRPGCPRPAWPRCRASAEVGRPCRSFGRRGDAARQRDVGGHEGQHVVGPPCRQGGGAEAQERPSEPVEGDRATAGGRRPGWRDRRGRPRPGWPIGAAGAASQASKATGARSRAPMPSSGTGHEVAIARPGRQADGHGARSRRSPPPGPRRSRCRRSDAAGRGPASWPSPGRRAGR